MIRFSVVGASCTRLDFWCSDLTNWANSEQNVGPWLCIVILDWMVVKLPSFEPGELLGIKHLST